ncbi:MAG TPA: histidine triad nucleotide-binding protein [Polyangia bacterium]|nr:histidine triad nucleotide-binding protein [Polyangia bacterium]
MVDCLFCKIRDQQIPAKIAHEDELCLAIHDINPQAPLHVLIIPRQHIATLNDITDAHGELIGHLFRVAAKLAREAGHADTGWRAVFNVNRGAGQSVFHVHLHVLGGRVLGWPPG